MIKLYVVEIDLNMFIISLTTLKGGCNSWIYQAFSVRMQ